MELITQEHLKRLSHHKQVMFACFCAEQVLHLVKSEHKEACQRAIKTVYLFLEGKASKEDCRVAASAAYNAAYHAASAAANASAYAASAAASAAAYTAYYTSTSAAIDVAADAADAASDAAAANAAYAASHAASAAAYTAAAPDTKQATVETQWKFYDQLLNGDQYFEDIVLKA